MPPYVYRPAGWQGGVCFARRKRPLTLTSGREWYILRNWMGGGKTVKILLLSGFLGSGKTSALLQLASYLVRRSGRDGTSVMIIENEIGEVGVDDKVLKA